MDTIKVSIDREAGAITIYNNGKGIPIEIHEKEKIYIPELIFGHLLTSSNYDDDQRKVSKKVQVVEGYFLTIKYFR